MEEPDGDRHAGSRSWQTSPEPSSRFFYSLPEALPVEHFPSFPQPVLSDASSAPHNSSADKGLGTHKDFFNSHVNSYYTPYHETLPISYPLAITSPTRPSPAIATPPVTLVPPAAPPSVTPSAPFYSYAPSYVELPIQPSPAPSPSMRSGSTQGDVERNAASPSDVSPPPLDSAFAPILPRDASSKEKWRPRERRLIFGIRPAIFWTIVGLIAFLAISGAVIGGVLGSMIRTPNSPGTSTEGSNGGGATGATLGTPLRSSSRIAAVNWTDSSPLTRYGVVSQDTYDNLIFSLWNHAGRNWTAVNVSEALRSADMPIQVRSGTPLAAVAAGGPANAFELRIYYVTTTNMAAEIKTADETCQVWTGGEIPPMASRPVSATSQLAAVWPHCPNGCPGEIQVVFQSSVDWSLKRLNSTDWSRTETLWEQNDAGGALALTSFGDDPVIKPAPTDLRAYFERSGILDERLYGLDGQWIAGQIVSQSVPSSSSLQLAAASFNSWTNVLVLQKEADGALTAHMWDDQSWKANQRVRLIGGPTTIKFESIAMNEDKRVYGVENTTPEPTIHEFRWYETSPSTLNYVGTVPIHG